MKKGFIWILAVALILSACSKVEEPPEVPAVEPMTVEEWPYDLTVDGQVGGGIAPDTVFTLTGEEPLELDAVKAQLSFEPAINYALTETDARTVVIRPSSPLDKDTVYRVKYKPHGDETYSWAFQTERTLQVVSTLPGNGADYVPVNSGIEIQLNLRGVEDPTDYFTITPHVEGRFSNNGYNLVFIPEALERGTTYEVTLGAGYGLEGSEMVLEEDYQFRFSTEPVSWNERFEPTSVILNYTTAQNHFVPVYMNEAMASEVFTVQIHAFPSADDYLAELQRYDESHSFEVLYGEGVDLETVMSFESSPVSVQQGYMTFQSFEMPEPLEPGYYLVSIGMEGRQVYVYLQINDLLVYNAEFDEEGFFWVLDAPTGEAIQQAEIVVNGQSAKLTGNDGTVRVPFEEDGEEERLVTYATISAAGYPDYVLRNAHWFYPVYSAFGMPYIEQDSNEYWSYLFTDRSTYLPTDEMNLFGYLQAKDGSMGAYQVQLISNVNGEDVLATRTVRPDAFGTFEAQFEWEEWPSGWYSLKVLDGETTVKREDFNIQTYTKPVYKLEGDFDKDVVGKGETVTYDLMSQFYDGTPAPGMAFNYYMYLGDSLTGKVVTDASGNAAVTLTPKDNTTSWRPIQAQIEFYNDNAEDTRVTKYDRVTFLPKNRMVELAYSDEGEVPAVTVLGHELVAEQYDPSHAYDYSLLRGAPIDGPVEVSVTEIWFDKVDKGQYYDYVNKVTRNNYEYIRRTEVVQTRTLDLVGGEAILEMPYVLDSKSTFEVLVTLKDSDGEDIVENLMVHVTPYPYFEPNANYYNLELDGDRWKFGVGETIRYRLNNTESLEERDGDKLLIMQLKDGLKDYSISGTLSGEVVFTEAMIPNFFIQGVYYRDGEIVKTSYPSPIRYDYTEREMTIEAWADKTGYGPGEEVALSFRTTDPDGNGVPASLNVSIVDEAYFGLFGQSADMLAAVYAVTYDTGILYEYLSSDLAGGMETFRGMAEGGDAAEYYIRSVMKDTATFLSVETDEDGFGTITFKLPDNLTSWRVTTQGIDQGMNAGTSVINLESRLPLFLTTIVSEVFITGDIPSISLRVFGDEAVKGEPVDYRVVLEGPDGEQTFEETGRVGNYTAISLGALEPGDYTLTTYADSTGLTDALEEHFSVVDSTVRFENLEHYTVRRGMTFDKVYSPAALTFRVENESTFYNSLMDLRFSSGKRVDQILSGIVARDFVRTHFEPDFERFEPSLNSYQNYDGGIKLLPYGESDPLISARVALLDDGAFREGQWIDYFYSIVYDQNADRLEVISALTGLAALGEPVLIDLGSLESETDLSPLEQILMGLAHAKTGDLKGANRFYRQVVSGEEAAEQTQGLALLEDPGLNHLANALTMNLALAVGDEKTGDMLFDHVYTGPSDYELSLLEQMAYLESRDIMASQQIASLSGSARIRIGDTTEDIELFGFESRTLTVTAEELANLEIQRVDGNLGVHVQALGGLENLEDNRTDDYALERSYAVDNSKTTAFETSDEIVVTLDPQIKGDAHHIYRVTDFIPAGFRFVRADQANHWYEQEGQKITFYYSENEKSHQPIRYTIQAVMPGTYTADHAVIVRIGEVGTNHTGQQVLTVQ